MFIKTAPSKFSVFVTNSKLQTKVPKKKKISLIQIEVKCKRRQDLKSVSIFGRKKYFGKRSKILKTQN